MSACHADGVPKSLIKAAHRSRRTAAQAARSRDKNHIPVAHRLAASERIPLNDVVLKAVVKSRPTYLSEIRTLARINRFEVEPYFSIDPEQEALVLSRCASRPEAPRYCLSTGMHGDEPAGPLALIELLANRALPQSVHWTIFPSLNPYGLAHGIRENAQGLDLNRDYLRLESPEVRAHRSLLENETRERPFTLYVAFHEDWEAAGFYLYEILEQPTPCLALGILKAVSEVMPLDPGPIIDGHTAHAPGYIQHAARPDIPDGWPEAIFHCKLKTVHNYTFETPSTMRLETRIQAHIRALTTTLEILGA